MGVNTVTTLKDICIRQDAEQENITRFHCRVPSAFYGFEGHFEGQPILPGVCQLKLVMEAVSTIASLPDVVPLVKQVERMKFHNVIIPETSIIVEIERQPFGWRYRIYGEAGDFASGKLVTR